MRDFRRLLDELLKALDYCCRKRLLMPCLILLYSGIDAVASLERQKEKEGTGQAFRRWVEDYLLKARSLPCTALDLYGARCGIIHAFSAESDLFREGKARQLFYDWGPADRTDLQEASGLPQRSDCVWVRVRDLIGAFRDGLEAYFDELRQDPSREKAALDRAGVWMTHMASKTVKIVVKRRRRRGGT